MKSYDMQQLYIDWKRQQLYIDWKQLSNQACLQGKPVQARF